VPVTIAEENTSTFENSSRRTRVEVHTSTMEEKSNKLPNGETTQDYKLVSFAEGDPENPKNWSKWFKWYITMVVAATCFVVALCSSIVTADIIDVEEEFHISHEAALVPVTVFVIGFGVGKCHLSGLESCS
jgi:Ca2+/H+ antiporter